MRIRTEAGDLLVRLADDAAPVTVANLLAHVDAHGYTGAFLDRVVRPDQPDDPVRIALIQGGPGSEAPLPPIPHETTRETGLAHRDGTDARGRFATQRLAAPVRILAVERLAP